MKFIGRVAWLYFNFSLLFFAMTCVGLGLAYLFMLLDHWLLTTSVKDYTPLILAFVTLFSATLAASIIVALCERHDK